MELIAVSLADRPDLSEPAGELSAVWPEYNHHGVGVEPLFRRLLPELPEFQLLLIDREAGDEVAARGRTVPVGWDGTVAGLPSGLAGALQRGFELLDAGGSPDALCAVSAEVRPDRQGRGVARQVLQAMRACARHHGLHNGLIAPVRPSWKERYPLTPIERYVTWKRADGLPLDPWMRVHARLGAETLKPEPRSLRITGTVAEWESWVGLQFPESGTYVFPGGLATVEIDRERDVGDYWEPNVWMHHR